MDQWFKRRQSRRRMLKKLGVLAGVGLAVDAGAPVHLTPLNTSRFQPIGPIGRDESQQ